MLVCYEKLFAFTRWRTKTTSWYEFDRCHIDMCDWYTGLNCYSKHVSDREDIIQTSILINLVSEKLYYCFPRSCIYKSFNWCDFILRYAKLRLKFTYKRYCPFLIFFLNASKFLNFQSHADSQTKIAILYRIIKRRNFRLLLVTSWLLYILWNLIIEFVLFLSSI